MKSAPWIIILILLGVIFLQRECTPSLDYPDSPEVIYDTVFDTIVYSTTVYIPQPVYRDTGSTHWRLLPVDTLQILSDYFARFAYQDTLQNDSNAIIVVTDTISQNRITYRHPQITLFPHLIRETTVVKLPSPIRRKLFVGLNIGRNPHQFSLAPTLMYLSRKQTAYSFSYDVLSGDVFIGMYWKLGL